MNKIKVSVVLPCYNVESYIRRGLDSVIAQSLQEWEAILVDDGATDSTGRICDEYAERDSRFRVIHTQNQGLPCARNNGMKYVSGELLYFMDPDDWIEPNCFERCYEIYQKYPCDIIHFGFWWCYEGCEKIRDWQTTFSIVEGDDIYKKYTCPEAGFGQEQLNRYYRGENIWTLRDNGSVWTCLFSRDFVVENNLLFLAGVTMNEDYFFLIEATYKAKKIIELPDAFYNYYQRRDSIVHMKRSPSFLFNYKFRHIKERQRLREMIKEFDLHDSYLGTHILSCLQLALLTSGEMKWYKQFRKYVCHPAVEESIRKVCLKDAPLKFSIPVRMLKMHLHFLLWMICWGRHKLRLSKKNTM